MIESAVYKSVCVSKALRRIPRQTLHMRKNLPMKMTSTNRNQGHQCCAQRGTILRAQRNSPPSCNSLKLALELSVEIVAPNDSAWPLGANP